MLNPGGKRSRVSALIAEQGDDLNQVQTKTLQGWVNYHLSRGEETPVSDLSVELMDGVVLAKLLRILTGEEVPKVKAGQTRRIQMIENCNLDLRFMKTKGVPFFNISAEDIVDGQLKMILALIWALACCFSIRPGMKTEEGQSVAVSDDRIKKLMIEFLCEVTEMNVTNLKEDLTSGRVLAKMVQNIIKSDKGLDVTFDESLSPSALLQSCFTSAEEHLHVPSLLEPGDVCEGKVDEKSMMLFLSLFQNIFRTKRDPGDIQQHIIEEDQLKLKLASQLEEEFNQTLSNERNAFTEKLKVIEDEKESIRLELERLEELRRREKEELDRQLAALAEADRKEAEDLQNAALQEKLLLAQQAEEAQNQLELETRRNLQDRQRLQKEREELERLVNVQRMELEKATEAAEAQKREYEEMLLQQQVDAEVLRAEQEALRQELLIQDALRAEALLLEQEELRKAQEELKKAQEEHDVSDAEKEQTALKILQELQRAEKEKMAGTSQVPVAYRNLGNQPVGGEWAGSVYVHTNNPGATYDPSKATNTTAEAVQHGFAGLMSKTKDLGSRIGKEMKHSFVEGRVENDHETTKRFNERFKFEKEEPFYLEFSCKFTASGGTMMIGFGYVTKNFLCFTGGNARDLMSVIIPLIDIKSISMGSTAMFSSYSAVPKITAVTNPSKANAILVFDIYEHVHNIFSVNNPNHVLTMLNLRVEDCRKSTVPQNYVSAEAAANQVATSTYKAERVDPLMTTTSGGPSPTIQRVESTDAEPIRRTTSRPPVPPPTTASPVPHHPPVVPRGSSTEPLHAVASPRASVDSEAPNPQEVIPPEPVASPGSTPGSARASVDPDGTLASTPSFRPSNPFATRKSGFTASSSEVHKG